MSECDYCADAPLRMMGRAAYPWTCPRCGVTYTPGFAAGGRAALARTLGREAQIADLRSRIRELETRLAEREGLEKGTESTPKVKWTDSSGRIRSFLTPMPLEAESALAQAREEGRREANDVLQEARDVLDDYLDAIASHTSLAEERRRMPDLQARIAALYGRACRALTTKDGGGA